jgi:hypothetical protein
MELVRVKNMIRVGDTVEVTNKYKGRLGVQGTVIKLTPAQVVIYKLDSSDTFRKYKANIKEIR